MTLIGAFAWISFDRLAPGTPPRRSHHSTLGSSPQEPTGFLSQQLSIAGHTQHVTVYVPERYSPHRNWPLLVYLHSDAERGEHDFDARRTALGRAIAAAPQRWPFVVVFPHNSEVERPWHDLGGSLAAVRDEVRTRYRIPPRTRYLLGVEQGGTGVWAIAATAPEEWDAFVPIGGTPSDNNAQVGDSRIWAFPIDDDHVDDACRRAFSESHVAEWLRVGPREEFASALRDDLSWCRGVRLEVGDAQPLFGDRHRRVVSLELGERMAHVGLRTIPLTTARDWLQHCVLVLVQAGAWDDDPAVMRLPTDEAYVSVDRILGIGGRSMDAFPKFWTLDSSVEAQAILDLEGELQRLR